MDGSEFCSSIKKDIKTSHIPFILLTSKGSNQSQIDGLGFGADDYMVKPFNFSILEAKIKTIIENRRRVRERFSKGNFTQSKTNELQPFEQQFLEKVIVIIEKHLSDAQFDVEQLEDELCMSNMQLYRKLKQITGFSGNEFIRKIRLERAFLMLESGQFNVSEVAFKVGFNDLTYFGRSFKKQFQKTPSEVLGAVVEN
jgi:AraC-like DNA-binding protein